MRSEIIIWSVSLLGALGWGLLLFWIGQKKRNTAIFYSLLYGPFVLFVILALMAGQISYSIASLWSLLLIVAIIAEKVMWGITLKHASGEDKLVWFYVVLLVPLFGWLLYWLTQVR